MLSASARINVQRERAVGHSATLKNSTGKTGIWSSTANPFQEKEGRRLEVGYDLWIALQPLIDLRSGRVVAHEALLRGAPGTEWEAPAALFAKARQLGHRVTLEAIARDLGIRRLQDLPSHQKLFVNIDALSPEIPALPGHPEVSPSRVVLELSEQQPVLSNPQLLDQVKLWRSQGHSIALDDYGSGYMGIGAILTLKPDILKLDRVIIGDIDQDHVRQTVVRHLVHMCRDLEVTLLAEGIETLEELWTVQELGVPFGQGFLLGRPQREPVVSDVVLPSNPVQVHTTSAGSSAANGSRP